MKKKRVLKIQGGMAYVWRGERKDCIQKDTKG